MEVSERASRWLHRVVLPLAVGGLCVGACDRGVHEVTSLGKIENGILLARAARKLSRADAHLRMIVLTANTTTRLGLPPGSRLPRSLYGRLIRDLERAGVRTALVDIQFDEPRPEDTALRADLRSLRTLNVTLLAGYADGTEFEQTAEGIRGRYAPCVVAADAMPHVAVGGGQPLQLQEGGLLVGAIPWQEGIGLAKPRLHVAFVAAAQFMGQADAPPQLDADARSLAIGSLEWPLQENHAVLVHWTDRRDDVPQIEFSEALRALEHGDARGYAGKIVVIGDARGTDDFEAAPFGRVPGSLFVANMVNTLLQPGSVRWAMLPDSMFYTVATLLAATAFSFGFARRALVSIVGVALVMVLAWTLPIILIETVNRLQPTFSPTLAALMAGVVGMAASQSSLFREDHRAPGASEEATVLFVDLRGSTSLLIRLGTHEFGRSVAALLHAIDRTVRPFGGTVERTLGDGCLVVFRPGRGSHPVFQAADAAVAILDAAHEVGARQGCELPVGIGFETGIVSGAYVNEGGRRAWSSVGTTVNLAQRLQAASEGLGESILFGPVARRLLEGERRTRVVGHVDAKGFDTPVEAGSFEDQT